MELGPLTHTIAVISALVISNSSISNFGYFDVTKIV
jgi:hypothetical protein